MSHGPDEPENGSPQDHGPDPDWLYGDRRRPAQADETRLIPKMSRQPEPASTARPGPAPLQPGPDGKFLSAPAPERPRPTIRIKWKRVILLFVVLPLVAWMVFLIAVPWISWSKIQRVDAFPNGARPADGKGTNYLLVGSDSRRGLSKDQIKKLGLGGVAEDGGRTDTIMIMHRGSGGSTLLSIPRDTSMAIPNHGNDKINAAFAYGGPKLLIRTLENNLKIRIDHYAEIGLGGFVNAVDAVGGVQICPKRKLNDKRANLHIKKGCQKADGATALAWARSRHAFNLEDLSRAQHQRELVSEVGDKAKSAWTVILPWRYVSINNAAVNTLTVDKDMGFWNLVGLARGMSSIKKSCTLPLAAFITPLPVDWTKTRELMGYFNNDDTAHIPAKLCSKTGLS